jgi:ABC-type branched-subunit amino acid transport system ATPase component
MSETILEIKGLESWYGKVQILQKVHMHLKKGEIVSIIGPNGCGKSTLLKNVFGLIEKNKGKILLEGKEIIKKMPNDIVKLGISFVPQGRSIFPSLTVKENIEMGAYIREKDVGKDIEHLYQMFPILRERKHQRAGLLSGGEQQMVAIARALMLKPKVMLLDEPSLGLSPLVKRLIFHKLKEINKMGVTLLIVEQNARMALEMCDRAYVLELGMNKYHGTGKELLNDKRVQKLYLGGA